MSHPPPWNWNWDVGQYNGQGQGQRWTGPSSDLTTGHFHTSSSYSAGDGQRSVGGGAVIHGASSWAAESGSYSCGNTMGEPSADILATALNNAEICEVDVVGHNQGQGQLIGVGNPVAYRPMRASQGQGQRAQTFSSPAQSPRYIPSPAPVAFTFHRGRGPVEGFNPNPTPVAIPPMTQSAGRPRTSSAASRHGFPMAMPLARSPAVAVSMSVQSQLSRSPLPVQRNVNVNNAGSNSNSAWSNKHQHLQQFRENTEQKVETLGTTPKKSPKKAKGSNVFKNFGVNHVSKMLQQKPTSTITVPEASTPATSSTLPPFEQTFNKGTEALNQAPSAFSYDYLINATINSNSSRVGLQGNNVYSPAVGMGQGMDYHQYQQSSSVMQQQPSEPQYGQPQMPHHQLLQQAQQFHQHKSFQNVVLTLGFGSSPQAQALDLRPGQSVTGTGLEQEVDWNGISAPELNKQVAGTRVEFSQAETIVVSTSSSGAGTEKSKETSSSLNPVPAPTPRLNEVDSELASMLRESKIQESSTTTSPKGRKSKIRNSKSKALKIIQTVAQNSEQTTSEETIVQREEAADASSSPAATTKAKRSYKRKTPEKKEQKATKKASAAKTKIKEEEEKYFPSEVEQKGLYSHGRFVINVDQCKDKSQLPTCDIWRIRYVRNESETGPFALQRYEAVDINGRILHTVTDRLIVFEKKDKAFYARYNPIYTIKIIDTDKTSIFHHIHVQRLTSHLLKIEETKDLFCHFYNVTDLIFREIIFGNVTNQEENTSSGSSWSIMTEECKSRVLTIVGKLSFGSDFLRACRTYPVVSFTGSEKTYCGICPKRTRNTYMCYKPMFQEEPYDEFTFDPIPDEQPPVVDVKICRPCKDTVVLMWKLQHHKWHMYTMIRSYVTDLVSELDSDEKLDAQDVMNSLLKDYEWLTKSFLEFQVLLAEADKLIEKISKNGRGGKDED